MKLDKIALGLTVLTLIVLLVPIVSACELPPGYSPGYWKHEVRAQLCDRGAKHYSPSDFAAILAGTLYTLEEAYMYLWDNAYKSMWLDVANAFNEAAGLAPYEG